MDEYAKKYIGMTNVNNQGCEMTIVEYSNTRDIVVEFNDEYKARKRCRFHNFKNGDVKNPFSKSVLNIGITGDKYPTKVNGKNTKEYKAWSMMIRRCYNEEFQKAHPTYKNASCCEEWLYYPNFYEWLHSQENFDKWHDGNRWSLDKDIVKKGSKIYSPDTCCLVPLNVNSLFTKKDAVRGNLPIGVYKNGDRYETTLIVTKNNKRKKVFCKIYDTPEEAFLAYKSAKESHIKQVAQEEYSQGNITEKCYNAMMNYEVEITD